MELVAEYGKELVGLVNEMSPYLLLGFLFAGILRVAFPRRIITRYMGGNNALSALNASLLGIPLPLCSCGVIPTGIGFYRNGASRGSTLSFLISTPQTGVDSILATYALLGLPMAIIRPVAALFTGVAGGILGTLTGKKEGKSAKQVEGDTGPSERSVRELFRYGFVELVQEITKWLVIGMLLAALLSVLVPDDFFTRDIRNEYLAMVLMLALSVPLYICATGSIPIAAVLMMKGLSPGAALVLLMAGPATNVATMAVIGNTMGRRSLMMYLSSIIGGALLFGILVNELLPRGWITSAIPVHMHGEDHGHGAGWLAWTSTVLLAGLMLHGWLARRFSGTKKASPVEGMRVYEVEGMTCNHCKAAVEKGIGLLQEVDEVRADPSANRVYVRTGRPIDAEVEETVTELGYRYGGKR